MNDNEIKVSQLNEATELNDNDIFMVVQEGVNKKIKSKKIGGNEVLISDDPTEITNQTKLYIDTDTGTATYKDGEAWIPLKDNEVIISDTEPTSNDNEIWVDTSSNATYMNQEVNIGPTNPNNTPTWFKMGKNIFSGNLYLENANVTSEGAIQSGTFILYFTPVIAGKTYTMSTGTTNRQWVYNFTTNTPKIGETGTTRIVSAGATETFTVPTGYNFLVLRRTDTGGEVISNLMINEGTSVDTYEAYIPPEIKVNDYSIYKRDELYGFELYSTTSANVVNSCSIKEDISHFKYIDVYCVQAGGNARPCVFRYFVFGNQIYVAPIFMGLTTTAHNTLEVRTALLSISGTTATLERNYNISITAGALNSTENAVTVIKIIGYK